jgi:glucose/arabinose dehydrogenase
MRLLVMLLTSFLLVQPVRAGTPEPGFSDTQYVGGLTNPTAIAFLPSGDLLITQQNGDLKLFNGSSTSTLVTIPVCNSIEMGLLGVALDPSFGTNGLIYLYRTKQGSSPPCGGSGRVNEVVSVTMSGGSVSLGSLVVLLTGMRTDNGNHDGGVLRMGPVDSKLYVGVGDTGLGDNVGGPGSSTNPYSQDLNELEGKVLRLNLDGTPPADNPFFGQVGKRGEIFAYGFRNPFRMSFDTTTGSLWVGDVGDLTVEEIDIMTSGGNYSWPRCEGNLQGPPGSPQPCVYGTDVAPIFTYPHSGGSSLGTCLIGGDFAGAAFGPLSGNYVFGDCTSSDVYLATVNGTRDGFTGTPSLASTAAGVPSDFVRGPDGAIYYVANGGGEVRRLSAALTGIDSPITGKTLNLKTASQNSVTAKSKDSAIDLGGGPGSSDDPTVGGGSVRIRSVSGGFDDTYPLPMGSSWSTIGDPSDAKGYRYKDPDQTNGPIKTVILRNGRLIKITGKGSGLNHTLTVNPDPVDVVLSTGTKRYCMSFGGTVRFTANMLFNAKDAPTGTCPP